MVSSFAVTVGLAAGLLLLFTISNGRPEAKYIGVALLIIGLTVFNAVLNPQYTDSEFSRTFALLILATVFVGWASGDNPNKFFYTSAFERAARLALYVVVTFACAQTLLGAAGSTALYNPWGPFQYQYEYEPQLQFVDIPRAPGFYLEPSYLAFIVGSCWVLVTAGRKSPRLGDTAVAVMGLLAARSATGFGLFVLILVLVALRTRSKTGIVAVGVLGTASGTYLIQRLSTGTEAGSSTYYRYTGPIEVLGDVLSSSPLGLPLGSVQKVIVNYDLLLGDQVGSSLDNGAYVVVFYLGWLGVILLCLAALMVIRAVVALPKLLWLIPFWAFGSLLFSGGILAPEYGIMMALFVLRFRTAADTAVRHHARSPVKSS